MQILEREENLGGVKPGGRDGEAAIEHAVAERVEVATRVEFQLALLGECGNGPPPSWHTRTTTGRQRQRAAAMFPIKAEEVDGPISPAPRQRTRVKSRVEPGGEADGRRATPPVVRATEEEAWRWRKSSGTRGPASALVSCLFSAAFCCYYSTRCSRRAYVERVTEMARVELELAKECGR